MSNTVPCEKHNGSVKRTSNISDLKIKAKQKLQIMNIGGIADFNFENMKEDRI